MKNEDRQTRETYVGTRYGRSQMFINWREQRIVAGLLKMAERSLPRILDIPSGHGRFTPQLRNLASDELVCCDISLKRLKALFDAEPTEGTPIEIREVDLFKTIPFETDEFDLVFNFRFFQHVDDQNISDQLIEELARVTRRYVIVSFYESAPLHSWQKRTWRRAGHKTTMPMPSCEQFIGKFENQGCRVIAHKAALPGIHAQRIVLFEKRTVPPFRKLS